jgi:hypothetical protein
MAREIDNRNPWGVTGSRKSRRKRPMKVKTKSRKSRAVKKNKDGLVIHKGRYPFGASDCPVTPMGSKGLSKYLQGKNVALVGNGLCLRDIADKVDSSDIVIRFNLDKRRLRWGYKTIEPPVPSGKKVNVMSGFWCGMNIPNIYKAYPSLELFLSLRPPGLRDYKYLFTRAGLYAVDCPVFEPTIAQYKRAATDVKDPVLSGISAVSILSQHNSFSSLTIYNFNFFVPALNKNSVDAKGVYSKYLHGKKGDRRYGDGKRPHRLTLSYKWLTRLINNTSNIKWDRTTDEIYAMDDYLL